MEDTAISLLRDLMKKYDEEVECGALGLDPGCIRCTDGATPNDRNTGPCIRHRILDFLKGKGENDGQ